MKPPPLKAALGSLAVALLAVGDPAVAADPTEGTLPTLSGRATAPPSKGFILQNVPRTGAELIGGYVMTHEHPTVGMAFGGNYAFARDRFGNANYENGIPESPLGTCDGCGVGRGGGASCDHGEFKGSLASLLGGVPADMEDHAAMAGVHMDSFSHLRYSSAWIREALDEQRTSGMKILVAFAVENEAMCEMLYYVNKGNGGAGGAGAPCSAGDSLSSLESQLTSLKNWAAAHSEWVEIAYTATQARTIANRHKLAVVLGVEAEYAFGAEDRTFDPVARLARYYAAGVRTFYLAHKINSRLAGADVYREPTLKSGGNLIRSIQAISGCFYYDDNVGNFPLTNGKKHFYCNTACTNEGNRCGPSNTFEGPSLAAGCNCKLNEISDVNLADYAVRGNGDFNGFKIYPRPPGFTGDDTGGTRIDGDGIERNNLSLSADGSRVVVEAMRRGMIVTLDHVSSRARTAIYDHSQTFYDYPVNALHNNPNDRLVDHAPNEYDFDTSELEYVKSTGGIVGVRLGPVDAKEYADSGVVANCPKTSTENAKILAWLVDQGQRVGYSLDFATITEGTHSRTTHDCYVSGVPDHLHTYQDPMGTVLAYGLAHIGQMKAWHDELAAVGLKPQYINELQTKSAEHFLRMWEKAEFIANMPATVTAIVTP